MQNTQITNEERFRGLCEQIQRDGIRDLLRWLSTTDFFEAPASTKYHDACSGGLLKHSLSVYDELLRLSTIYPDIDCKPESMIICALFHDFCKIDFYTQEKRNRKNVLGKWESYDAYRVDEKFVFGGHGSKSVYLIQRFMKLEPEEAVAINCHMGAFADEHVGQSYEQFPFAWLLHVADEAATYLEEE